MASLAEVLPFGILAARHGATSPHTDPGWLGGRPSWAVTLVVGAVLAALLERYGGLILYPLRALRKDQYLGEWWEYHASYRRGEPVVRSAKLRIRRGLRNDTRRASFWHVSAGVTDASRSDLRYKGTMKLIENDQLLVKLEATTHKETLVYRFANFIPSNMETVPGLWMSIDHDGRPAAGAAILADHELSDKDARAAILSDVTTAEGVLRIK